MLLEPVVPLLLLQQATPHTSDIQIINKLLVIVCTHSCRCCQPTAADELVSDYHKSTCLTFGERNRYTIIYSLSSTILCFLSIMF